jgi:hypothetical protein
MVNLNNDRCHLQRDLYHRLRPVTATITCERIPILLRLSTEKFEKKPDIKICYYSRRILIVLELFDPELQVKKQGLTRGVLNSKCEVKQSFEGSLPNLPNFYTGGLGGLCRVSAF